MKNALGAGTYVGTSARRENTERISKHAKALRRLVVLVAMLTLLPVASIHAQISFTWTNGSDNWTSTTAWQTNVFDSLTNQYTFTTNDGPLVVTNFCIATNTLPPGTAITILTNCTPGGVAATCQFSIPPGFTAGTPCVGGTGGSPSSGDQAFFTNAGPYNVRVNSPISNLYRLSVSNSLVTITIDTANSLNVTGRVAIGYGNGTATVYLAGGTLDYQDNSVGSNTVRIGDNSSSGTLIVTNGTVVTDQNLLVGASSTAVGKLVVSGPNTRISPGGFGGSLTVGSGSSFSQVIVSNQATVVLNGIMRIGNGGSNNLVLISDSGSVWSNWGSTAGVSMGSRGNTLIVSNGAKLWCDNGGTIGGGSSYNTGIVVGVGSTFFSGGGVGTAKNTIIGTSSAGSTNNCLIITGGGQLVTGAGLVVGNATPSVSNVLIVSDGGMINTKAGTLTYGSGNANCFGHTFYMGGVGAMSTGIAFVVATPNLSATNSVIISNAIYTCSQFNIRSYGNSLSVLSKGTLIINHDNGTPANSSSNVALSGASYNGGVTINGGTINAVGGGGTFTVAIGNSATLSGGSMIITNGGKLLSEQLTVGDGWSTTGIIAGAGSVLSNYTAGVYTNNLTVGVGAAGSNNYFAVLNGASLFNNGTFNIGNNTNATGNTVVFGGPGATAAVIVNTGNLKVGSGLGTSGNTLTVSNATVNTGTLNVGGTDYGRTNNTLVFKGGTISALYMEVRPTNTFTFSGGQLSVGDFDFPTGANNSNALVVGDGTSAAYYDMAAGGTGNHDFHGGGLVVTNGAFLRGSGTLLGNVTVLGTFAPGFSVGTVVASNNLTFGNAATLNYDLGTSSDSVTVGGDLALGGTVNVTDSGGFGANTYVLFTHTNTVSGTLNVGTLPGGFTAFVSNDLPNTPRILLVVSAVVTDPYANWATHYGLSGGSGNADTDGDGMNNTNEFLAGFNPTNNAAYVHVINVAKSTTNIVVTYLGASGDNSYVGGPASRTNVLESTTGTANGSYSNNFTSTGQTNILSGGSGLGTVTSFVDTNGASGATRYYRVRVLVP